MNKLLWGVAVVVVLSGSAVGDIIYVDDDAPSDGDGLSWATAFRFLQDALSEAADDAAINEIRGAQGTYAPDEDEAGNVTAGDRGATFRLVDGVSIMGGYAGITEPDPDQRDIELYETVLSGDLLGNDGPDFENNEENSYHVVKGSFARETALIDGFTISGGNADGGPLDDRRGGGLFNRDSRAVISNCRFVRNTSHAHGGAMYDENGSTLLDQCVLERNLSHVGGALYIQDGTPTVRACVFRANTGIAWGGAVRNNGSALFLDCRFLDNCSPSGGAMFNFAPGIPSIVNCQFYANRGADLSGGGGGAITNSAASPLITGCVFTGNFGHIVGGAIYNINALSQPTISNCSFYGNVAPVLGGGAIFSSHSAAVVNNCILWNNFPNEVMEWNFATTVINNSNVKGGWSGEGVNNIDADPLFVDPDNDDLHLRASSPCIDAGHNWGVALDAADLDADGDADELTPLDLDGNPRFADDAATKDTGCGVPVVVDMGSYEFQGNPADVVFADLDGDGFVTAADLLIVVGCTGSDDPGCCIADLDLDGEVTMSDWFVVAERMTVHASAGAMP